MRRDPKGSKISSAGRPATPGSSRTRSTSSEPRLMASSSARARLSLPVKCATSFAVRAGVSPPLFRCIHAGIERRSRVRSRREPTVGALPPASAKAKFQRHSKRAQPRALPRRDSRPAWDVGTSPGHAMQRVHQRTVRVSVRAQARARPRRQKRNGRFSTGREPREIHRCARSRAGWLLMSPPVFVNSAATRFTSASGGS